MLLPKVLQGPGENWVVFSALSTDPGKKKNPKNKQTKKKENEFNYGVLLAYLWLCQSVSYLACLVFVFTKQTCQRKQVIAFSLLYNTVNWKQRFESLCYSLGKRDILKCLVCSHYKPKPLAMHFIHDQTYLETTNCLLTWAHILEASLLHCSFMHTTEILFTWLHFHFTLLVCVGLLPSIFFPLCQMSKIALNLFSGSGFSLLPGLNTFTCCRLPCSHCTTYRYWLPDQTAFPYISTC